MKNGNQYKMTLVLICLLFEAFNLTAQRTDKYLAAKIIDTANTLREGYIRMDDLSTISSAVVFKDSLSQIEPSTYEAAMINNVIFTNGTTYERVNFKSGDKAISREILALLIQKGKLSLYETEYRGNPTYIVATKEKSTVLQDDNLMDNDKKQILREKLWAAVDFRPDFQSIIEKTSFSLDEINEIVFLYNKNNGGGQVLPVIKDKHKESFVVADAGGLISNYNGKGFYGNVLFRTYFPVLSNKISLNAGINFLQRHYTIVDVKSHTMKHTQASIPAYIQYNFLSKSFRPYVSLGISISSLKVVNENGESVLYKGFQQSYGIGVWSAAGIETNIHKNLYAKGEFRRQSGFNFLFIGIGYAFKFKQ